MITSVKLETLDKIMAAVVNIIPMILCEMVKAVALPAAAVSFTILHGSTRNYHRLPETMSNYECAKMAELATLTS